jgi:hypothetical protein
MKVEEAKYSIAEIAEWMRNRDLVVNEEYQRGGGLWTPSAKSYFIDTILNGFPISKIYFHEKVDRALRKPKKEIVDGQQRIGTIVEFLDGNLRLGNSAQGFEGKLFPDLTEDQQDAFYSYTLAVDVIRNAERADILQMFRRMNAYTLPLNEPEKRQSTFFGEFKSWVNTILDEYGSIFVDWGILSSRQVIRMVDAELVADLALAVQEGVTSTSPKKLNDLYKTNDVSFPDRGLFNERVGETLAFVRSSMSFVQKTYLTKPHLFHSLVCALIQNKWGLPKSDASINLPPIGAYWTSEPVARDHLVRLALAYEEKDLSRYNEFVKACSEGGNRAPQRTTRIRWLCLALRDQLP